MSKNFFLMLIAPYTAPIASVNKMRDIKTYQMSDYFGKLIFVLFGVAALSGVVNNDWISVLAAMMLLLYKGFYDALRNELVARGNKIDQSYVLLWSLSIIPVTFGVLEKMASYFLDLSIYQVLFYSHTFKQAAGLYRIYATFGNPNIAGTWFAALVIIGIGLYVNGAIKGPGNLLLLGANLQCLMWTGSKGAVLSMFVTLFVSFWTYKTSKRRILIAIIFIAIFVLSQGEAAPVTHSLQPRDHIWVTTTKVALEHWALGVGLLGGIDYVGEVHAHNLWFSMLLFTGVIGLTIVIAMQLHLLKQLWILYKHEHPYFPMLFGLLLVLGIHSAVDFTLISPQGSLLLVFFAATIWAAVERGPDQSAQKKQLISDPS